MAEAFERICEFPLRSPQRPQLGCDLRVAFSGRYAIYDRPTQEDIIVVRVLHGARDIDAIADEGGFSP